MKRKLLITLGFSILLVLTACGSDSKSQSSESTIKKKDFILIVHHQDTCSVSGIKKDIRAISLNLTVPKDIDEDSLVSATEKNSVYCEKYDRTYDDVFCEIWDFEVATEKSCVMGFDFE
jgi:hypothetical protein